MRKFPVGFEFRLDILITVVAVALALAGCGAKGPLRTPEGAMPEPIKDLRGKAGKQGVDLTWTRPTNYVDGKELNDLASFVVLRKEVSKNCPECVVPYRQRATVDVEDQQKFIKRKQFGFVDQEVQPGTTYRYRVFSKLRDDTAGGPSNEVEVTWRQE
jgi:predicted small lipoprotein YifL